MEFNRIQEKEEEILESILSGAQEKLQLDASDLNVRVPDLLLRECEKEIHRVGGIFLFESLVEWYDFSVLLPDIKIVVFCGI